ncbi:MAG: 30S ribosomal protein S9 [Deltaproteobacteria bacterium]|nr:30S ribosomal protein S9 [Deltaproteobacteria bacterium]
MAIKPICATGRRKTSAARVYISPAKDSEGAITVNKLPYEDYFPSSIMQMVIKQPIALTEESSGKYDIRVTVRGGGISSQAGAVLHGISRALVQADPTLRSVLKKGGFLTRDDRAVERKKPGRHKARKRPQFSKR